MRQILCPVDFSELSALALKSAGALAKCRGSQLTILYASPFLPPPYFTPGQVERLQREFRESAQQAEADLREFARSTLGASASFELKVVEAAPAEAIRSTAAEIGASLIAMGTHGRSGINHLMLGSVAERVLRETDVPVLTVRGGGPAAEAPFQHILAPVNDTPAARKALGTAAELAQCFGATLTLLHVQEPRAAAPPDFCAWVPAALRSQCDLREVTRNGEAAREIVAHASESPCDLLVIGAQHRRFFDSTVIGATTVRVVRHAPCPVLTVIASAQEAGERPRAGEAHHAL